MIVNKQVRCPFHEIVVPTDCSSGSTRALEFALALAGHGSRVTAVHAVDTLPYRFVLATSTRGPAARLLLGSVAEEVFRMVNCPVFVLGTKAAAAKNRKPSRLVFATDLEPHSLAALSQLSGITDRLGASVSVIRAVHPDITSRRERNRIRNETKQKVDAAADSALRKRIRKIHVEFAHPVKAIVGFANRLKADAIVMGIRSGGELTRASTHIPWALAHRVIAQAPCPVLTIRC